MRYAKTFGLVYGAIAAAIFAFAPPAHAEEAAPAEPVKINIIYTVQADDHSAGDEHEIEYDVAAAAATAQPDAPRRSDRAKD